MINYMRGMTISNPELGHIFSKALNNPDVTTVLQVLYNENEDWRKVIGNVIFLCLNALKYTGVGPNGNLLLLWIPKPGREWLVTLERSLHGWIPMLKDSMDCCTFAVLLEFCRELTWPLFKYGRQC